MNGALILSGGPTHEFAVTTPMLAGVLAEAGLDPTVVEEPAAVVEALRPVAGSASAPFRLLAVNALRWSMPDRPEAVRARWATRLSPDQDEVIDGFVRSGGALLALHTAVVCFDGAPRWRELCGASWDWASSSHPPVGASRVTVTPAGRDHPITAGLDDFVVEDEVYGFLDSTDDVVPLLSGAHGGRVHPLLWARQVGAGRVVTDLLGHGPASLEHPSHRLVLARAVTWLGSEG